MINFITWMILGGLLGWVVIMTLTRSTQQGTVTLMPALVGRSYMSTKVNRK